MGSSRRSGYRCPRTPAALVLLSAGRAAAAPRGSRPGRSPQRRPGRRSRTARAPPGRSAPGCPGWILQSASSLLLSGVVVLCCCVPIGGADQGWRVGHPGTVDDLHQQSPRREEVGPSVARHAGAVARDLLAVAEQSHARDSAQYRDRLVHVVHHEAQVVPAGVTVPRVLGATVGAAPLEELHVQVGRHAQHRQREARVLWHGEVLGHELRIRSPGRAIQLPRPQRLDEEPDGLVQVGHGERDVVGVPDAGDAGQLAAGARGHDGGPAVEARTSSSGVRTTCPTDPSAAFFSARSMAMLPMSAIGWRTVVRAGLKRAPKASPSKPTTETSVGTWSPRAASAEITPNATMSLAVMMAVGRSVMATKCAAARSLAPVSESLSRMMASPSASSRYASRRSWAVYVPEIPET